MYIYLLCYLQPLRNVVVSLVNVKYMFECVKPYVVVWKRMSSESDYSIDYGSYVPSNEMRRTEGQKMGRQKKYSRLLVREAVSLVQQLPMFRNIIVPSSSGPRTA